MHLGSLDLAAWDCAAALDLRVDLVASFAYLDRAVEDAAVASTLAHRVAFVRDVEAVQASFDLADAAEASDCVAFDLVDVVVVAFDRAGRAVVASGPVDRAVEAFELAEAALDRVALVPDAIEAASTLEVSKLVAYLAACWDDAQTCLEAVAAVVASAAEVLAAAVVAFEVAAERAVIPVRNEEKSIC